VAAVPSSVAVQDMLVVVSFTAVLLVGLLWAVVPVVAGRL
jgi:hypothetical protein